MKMTKKIFIALLILSVIVSIFAFTVSADESEMNYDYLLEYYEEPVLFDYTFTGDVIPTLLYNSADGITSGYTDDENAPGGRYLWVKVPPSNSFWEDATAKNNVYFNANVEDAPVDEFIVDMTVSGSHGDGSNPQLPKIIISLADAHFEDADIGADHGTTVVALDYRSGCFSYLKRTVDAEGNVRGTFTNTTFALTADTWYNVSLACDASENSATVTVTNVSDENDVYTAEDVYIPYTSVSNIRVGAHGTDGASARNSVMNFASLYAFGGTYNRVPSSLQSDIEAAMMEMYANFTSDKVDLASKEYIAGVVAKIHSHGFVTENEAVKSGYEEMAAGIAAYCNSKLVYYADNYKNVPTYDEKRAFVDEALVYVAYLNALDSAKIPDDIKDDVEANIARVNGLDDLLYEVVSDSIGLVAAVGNNTNVNYDDYAAVSERLNELVEYDKADPTYEGTMDAFVFYSTLREAKEYIETRGDSFIENANLLKPDNDFNTRAGAFQICKDNYDYFKTYPSYPGISSALSLYNFYYDGLNTQITAVKDFITYVNRADYADYISAKQENLDAATECMYILEAASRTYAGFDEAYELYKLVKAEIEEQIENAKLYVEAVNALKSLSGDALTQGIAKALELQKTGNVLGAEGVSDANIELDKIVSKIELSVKYRDYFIGLVEDIDKASTTDELYKALRAAKKAEKDADPEYQSVKDASAKLAAAINDYNTKVSVANTEFKKANEAAANTCGIGKGVTPVADRVIALIKKFFDEE